MLKVSGASVTVVVVVDEAVDVGAVVVFVVVVEVGEVELVVVVVEVGEVVVVDVVVGGVVVVVVVETSLSLFVTLTSAAFKLLYAGSFETAGSIIMEYGALPSTFVSSTPVTVTVWGEDQLDLVKMSLEGATVPSLMLFENRGMVTSAVGLVLSTTVKEAVPPDSVVTSPEVGLTVMPAGATSLSLLVTLTSDALALLKAGSVEIAVPVIME